MNVEVGSLICVGFYHLSLKTNVCWKLDTLIDRLLLIPHLPLILLIEVT